MAELAHVEVRSRSELRAWLAEHHEQRESVWLVTYKKATPDWYVSYDAIVEELICYGWIDSRVGKVDELRSKLMISPRRPGSGWSRVNKVRVAYLESAGRLAEPGRAMIEQARADGSWTALDEIEELVVPDELAAAFAIHPSAEAYWRAFPRSVKRGHLELLLGAKSAETRARRIADIVRYAEADCRFGFPGEREKLEARRQDGGA
ncbi:MAG: YdeI/OmpD-associated family protein [Fimbriimonadaceae bacterium]|nr:YdeI/OmpD-associated family protein [Fimbriimonadaceae bacterium]